VESDRSLASPLKKFDMSENLLSRIAKDRMLKHNQNFICAFVGPTGSGKSFASLALAEHIDPHFSVDRVVFSVREFLELLTSRSLEKGSVIVLDEASAGASLASRNWYSEGNKQMSFVLQTFRFENVALLLTMPSLGLVDVQARGLLHYLVDVQGVEAKEQRVRSKVFAVTCRRDGKIYYRYPHVTAPDGHDIIITKYYFGKPSEALIKQYEQRKQAYGRKVQLDALAAITQAEVGDRPKKLSMAESVGSLVEEAKTIMAHPEVVGLITKKGKGGKEREVVGACRLVKLLGITNSRARALKPVLEAQLDAVS